MDFFSKKSTLQIVSYLNAESNYKIHKEENDKPQQNRLIINRVMTDWRAERSVQNWELPKIDYIFFITNLQWIFILDLIKYEIIYQIIYE